MNLFNKKSKSNENNLYLIIIAGCAGSGKTTIGKELAKQLRYAYIDKDTVTRDYTDFILKQSGSFEGDRESDLYKNQILPIEYQVTFKVCREILESGSSVVLTIPFIGQIRDWSKWLSIKETARINNEVIVKFIWIKHDKGFFANNVTANIVVALLISLASLLPDKDERGTPLYLFDGHFYDPDDNDNYHGETTNTAKTNAAAHYRTAVEAERDGNMDAAFEHLGRCLHYVQDANEPHHASNVHALQIPYGASHGSFEKFAFENQEAYLDDYDTIPSSNYTNATSWNVDTITHKGAVEAKPMIQYVRNVLNQSNWSKYAEKSMKNAARYSAMVLYKIGRESVVPFYYN